MGFGLGLALASTLLILIPTGVLTDFQIESKARDLGMVYPQEVLVLQEREEEDATQGEDRKESLQDDGVE